MPFRPPTHKPPGSDQVRAANQRRFDRARADSEQQRLLNTRRWRRFSAMILMERPSCEDCCERDDGTVRPSRQVHHVDKLADHPETLLDPEKVKALCVECHSVRTARGE